MAPREDVVECDCGERLSLPASTTTCGGCGADHKAVAEEGLDFGRLRGVWCTPGTAQKIAETLGCLTKRAHDPSGLRFGDYSDRTYSGP